MKRLYQSGGKRLVDLLVALPALLLFSPIIAVLALLVRLRLGSPVLFRQLRPGLHGKPFELMKFRTMREASDEHGNPLPDEERMTPFGLFLRRASLDELPTLLNVVLGHMSLVGPRPLLVRYLERFTPEQARRHEVRPGVTGWAQVRGRTAITWDERLRLDVWYVDHLSLWLDVKILFLTVRTVLKREGISHAEHVTMPEFYGTLQPDDVPHPKESDPLP